MTEQNIDICKKLYEYLACNDTIHDFGKGADRGKDIKIIVQNILQLPIYKEFTPFGENKNITLSNFERSVEEFILYNCNLPGIPESVLAQSPYLISSKLGDTNAVDVKDVEIYRFINKNKNVNYGIKLFSYQVLGLTDIQRKNIFEDPSNIDPAISFFSTIIIEDQYETNGIRKLFNWMEDELNAEENVTSLLPNSKDINDRPDIKKNKIGNFLINTFFYTDEGSGYKGFIYNTDAVAGNLKCAFSKFNNNVLGGVKDTANYGDSAGTEETGGDEEDSSSKNKVSTCGKNKKTRIGDNLFDLVVGYFNVEQKERGRLSIQVTENPDHLPSLFPASNGEPKGRKVYFFSNNFFTKDNFTIAYVETENKNWKPYFQPYNFSLHIYSGSKTPELMKKIQSNPEDPDILIGEAPFSSGDNGPSVVYLKDLIDAVNKSTSQQNLLTGVSPEGKVLNINKLIIDIYKKLSGNHVDKKTILIKLLLDLKRCGDFEQVDAIRMIQDQNEGTNNRFGLQDILFTTGDRLCSLYSRFKNTNVQFFVASTQRYYLYRQPYIYPSEEVRTTILQKNIFNELKQKAIRAETFMTNIKEFKDFDIETSLYPSDPMDPEKPLSYVKSLFTYIYLFQKERLNILKSDAIQNGLESKIQFCKNLKDIKSFEDMQTDKKIPFYFNGTILSVKIRGNQQPVNCNQIIDSFYFLSSSEIFSEIKPTTGKTTIFLLDFISKKETDGKLVPLSDDELKQKLKQYYDNMSSVYQEIIEAYNNIKFSGTSRARKVSVVSYLKYSNQIIAFLQLCNLIFGSLDEINDKINELENINNNLEELKIREAEQTNKRRAEQTVTPESTVDFSTTSGALGLSLDFEPKNTFKEIVNKLEKATSKIEENKININQTKQERKEQKQQQQKKKQKEKEEKKKNKMLRAVKKIQALNEIKGNLISKGKLFKEGLKKSDRISVLERKSSLRSSSPPGSQISVGGAMIQKGGGVIDALIGNKLEELYADVNIIAFMNQIYSNLMPYELLLILLTEFDFEYSGVSDASGNMVPLSKLSENLSATTPDYYPMVLSRGKYLLKFQTELSNLISNPNIGLTEEQKQMLESFTTVVSPVVPETTEETTVEYNTEELETKLASENFKLTPIIEQMANMVLSKKNVPCFLSEMNSDTDSVNNINNYLNGMGNAWLTILKNLSESEREDNTDLNIFQHIIFDITETGVLQSTIDRATAPGLNIPSNDVKDSLQNIHLITTLLTIDFSAEQGQGCRLINPFPTSDLSMSTYFGNLTTALELNNICNPSSSSSSSPNLPNITIIVKKLFELQQKSTINIRILIIYLLSILGAILFDVTELYFPNFINEENQKQLLTIIGGQGTSSVLVTNEEIMKNFNLVLDNILSKIPTETCEQLTREGMGGGRKKTKKNRKHSKNRSIRFK